MTPYLNAECGIDYDPVGAAEGRRQNPEYRIQKPESRKQNVTGY